MIPKVLHYCWFGKGEKGKLFDKCYQSWIKFCPDYQIIEWNESNFDIDKSPRYVQDAYRMGKWAFVADYVRLKVVYESGGIYLDTDVELIKPIDKLMQEVAFFGFQRDGLVASGLGFGSEKNTALLKALIQDYDSAVFVKPDGTLDLTDCPTRNKHVFCEYGLISDGSRQVLTDGTLILEAEVLCPMDYESLKKKITKNTISIHWFAASWKQKRKLSSRIIIRCVGFENYKKIKAKVKRK